MKIHDKRKMDEEVLRLTFPEYKWKINRWHIIFATKNGKTKRLKTKWCYPTKEDYIRYPHVYAIEVECEVMYKMSTSIDQEL